VQVRRPGPGDCGCAPQRRCGAGGGGFGGPRSLLAQRIRAPSQRLGRWKLP
jgi:hypothetical protein